MPSNPFEALSFLANQEGFTTRKNSTFKPAHFQFIFTKQIKSPVKNQGNQASNIVLSYLLLEA
jgi:hypothetical protein